MELCGELKQNSCLLIHQTVYLELDSGRLSSLKTTALLELSTLSPGNGYVINVRKYFKKRVCDDRLGEARTEYPLTEEEVVL